MKQLFAILAILAILGGGAMAQTSYTAHYLVFVEAARLNTANNLARNWDPESDPGDTFTVPLSPTGLDPATYYAASTRATETMSNGITTALGNLSWAEMYWTADVTVDVPHWTGPGGWEFDGSVYAAWLSALADMGLQRIQPPGP